MFVSILFLCLDLFDLINKLWGKVSKIYLSTRLANLHQTNFGAYRQA